MPRTECPLLSDKPTTKNLANLTRSQQAHGSVQNATDHELQVVLAGTDQRPELGTSVDALSDNDWGALLSCHLAYRDRPLSDSTDVQRCRSERPGLVARRLSAFRLRRGPNLATLGTKRPYARDMPNGCCCHNKTFSPQQAIRIELNAPPLTTLFGNSQGALQTEVRGIQAWGGVDPPKTWRETLTSRRGDQSDPPPSRRPSIAAAAPCRCDSRAGC